jgi:hypothetical protein
MVARTNTVIELAKAYGKTVVGNTIKEFEIKPMGKGDVTVTIKVTAPIGGDTGTIYKFTVE